MMNINAYLNMDCDYSIISRIDYCYLGFGYYNMGNDKWRGYEHYNSFTKDSDGLL